jgi:chaperone LolA
MSRFGIHLLLLLSAALFSSSATAAQLSSAETADLLKSLQVHREKNPALVAEFTEQKASRLLAEPLVSQGTLSFQAPNKFRRELKGKNPSMTVSNGQRMWIYYPNFKEAELYQLGQRAFFDDAIAALTAGLNLQQVSDFYGIKAFREENKHRLVLTPRTSGLRRLLKELTVWLEPDLTIDRTEALLPKGDRVVTNYRNPRSAPLPASTFEFTPPKDANVTQPLGK